MKKNLIYGSLFVLLVTLLFMPLFQNWFHLCEMKPLNGFTPEQKRLKISIERLLSGEYQENTERYIGDNLGFRELFIRTYNQYAYSCFREINNDNIKEGAQQEFFLKMYLDDITGVRLQQYYPDVEAAKADAQKNVDATLALIDSLQRHGTEFLFVFAPSKTALYPELMPSEYRQRISDFSLEEYYLELFKENGIPHIDFLSYFRSIKDSFPYPLYTRTGTHWSEATIPMVADSILRKLEELTGCSLASIDYIDPNLSTEYSVQDGELEASMNLLFPLHKPAVPKPVFALTDTAGKDRPNLLVVGDCYFIQLQQSCFIDAFGNWDYWKYNRYTVSSREDYNFKEVEQLQEAPMILNDADIVLAVFTSPCFCNYMYGFANSAVELYRRDNCLNDSIL